MRAFIALEPETAAHAVLLDALRRLRKVPYAQDVKWVSEDNLHLTMRFLGEIDEAQKAKMVELIANALPVLGAPGTMHMSEPRLFPKPAHARVIACMVAHDAWLSRLADACERAAEAIGLPAERRPFAGHITLGRTRESFQWRAYELWPASSTPFTPAALTLFKSTLTPRGSIYAPLANFSVTT